MFSPHFICDFAAIHAAAPYLAKSPAADKAIIVTGSEASF